MNWNKAFSGQYMMTYFYENGNPNTSNYTLICHHKLCSCQDITVHGIIMARNYYTHPLIAPDLPLNHHGANCYNSKESAIKNNPIFANCCQFATVQAILDYQETHFAILAKA